MSANKDSHSTLLRPISVSFVIFPDQIMLRKRTCVVLNTVNDLSKMFRITFGIERIGINFKGNTAFSSQLLQKYRDSRRHRKPLSFNARSALFLIFSSIRKLTCVVFAIVSAPSNCYCIKIEYICQAFSLQLLRKIRKLCFCTGICMWHILLPFFNFLFCNIGCNCVSNVI